MLPAKGVCSLEPQWRHMNIMYGTRAGTVTSQRRMTHVRLVRGPETKRTHGRRDDEGAYDAQSVMESRQVPNLGVAPVRLLVSEDGQLAGVMDNHQALRHPGGGVG